ncbi:MAG: hypothetical protein H0U87_05725 [Acidobacteria bacterium]|jgi:hypothetical protein|nr:hypothetical protein [Acidobacteriota bacterium]
MIENTNEYDAGGSPPAREPSRGNDRKPKRKNKKSAEKDTERFPKIT